LAAFLVESSHIWPNCLCLSNIHLDFFGLSCTVPAVETPVYAPEQRFDSSDSGSHVDTSTHAPMTEQPRQRLSFADSNQIASKHCL
jgi:hypothetical protein